MKHAWIRQGICGHEWCGYSDSIFTNDSYVPPADRNLYVDYVTVGATTVQAEGAMILDYGGGLTAFDGANVVAGAEGMGPSGAFRFVLGAGAAAYGYDKNGNISYKLTPGQADVFAHDAAGRMRQVKRNGAAIAQYNYDGDGNRVQSIVNSVTTKFVGGYFEWTGTTSTMVKYYTASGKRLAMRTGSGSGTTGLLWLAGDHLGSTSVAANPDGSLVTNSRQLYKPWGETRTGAAPTHYQYTGQRNETAIGLYFYNARWYDNTIGRFVQADTIIPASQGVQAWDRFAYVNNSPTGNTDPTGHCIFGLDTIVCWAAAAIISGVIVGVEAYKSEVAPALGRSPDYRGVDTAEQYMNLATDSALVAAGIAVQSQWEPLDVFGGDSFGIAQTKSQEINSLGLGNLDPQNPMDAIRVMDARIAAVQGACDGCSSTDLLIAAALGQNGSGFSADSMVGVSKKPDGSRDWEAEFSGWTNWKSGLPGVLPNLRWAASGMQYDTRLMLRLYLNDLKELLRRGWSLPPGYEDVDWEYIEQLASPPDD